MASQQQIRSTPDWQLPAIIRDAEAAQSTFAKYAWQYIERGISVVPIAPGSKKPGVYDRASGWRGMSDWTRFATRMPNDREIAYWSTFPDAGIGIVLGPISKLVGIDRDYDTDGTDALDALIPYTPFKKKGEKGYTAFFQFNGERSCSFNINGVRVMDVLAEGRQTVVPPTMHPTGCAYVWTGELPLTDIDSPLDLPKLPDDFIAQVEKVIAPYQNDEDRKYQKKHIAPREDGDRINTGLTLAAEYFRDINRLALDQIEAWVPKLIDTAVSHKSGYRCKATWRNAENRNVGITPAGIFDFGGNYGMTAIDLVMYSRQVPFNGAVDLLRACLTMPEIEEITFAPAVKDDADSVVVPIKPPPVAPPAAVLPWLQPVKVEPASPQSGDQGAGNTDPPGKVINTFSGLVDVYARHPVRPYPLACIPAALSAYAEEQSRSTGFDVGGIAFILIAGLAALIDTRGRIKASSTWGEPPMMFSCLTDDSGSGKSYMLNAGTRPLRRIADELVRMSAQDKAKWIEQYNEWESKSKNGRGPRPEKPSWLQLVINDATVEAIADVMQTNKRGGVVQVDELTGLIGSMDAYSAGGGASASKDRAVYLRLYDGGPQVINRKTSGNQVIPNMAVSIITTVQPDPLGDMYRRGGSGGADGMFQRFLTYRPQPAGQVNLRAETSAFVAVAVDLIADQINRWTLEDKFLEVQPSLDEAATNAFQDDCNALSAMAAGYDQPRLREHLGKYKGFLLRMCFAVHVIECASTPGDSRPGGGNFPPKLRSTVSADTLGRARGIIECLLNHSISLYEVIERDSPVTKLVRQVCDVILAKRWHTFTWGDLTRDVSTWNGCKDEWIKEGALDRLVAFGWIRDDTVPPPPGSRGRKSKGMFTVNTAVHTTFADLAARKAAERARRRDAFDPITGKLRPKG